MQWVSRITTVALMTVLPILGGQWLDGRLATSYWSPIGLVVGLVLGAWQLMLLVRSAEKSAARNSAAKKSENAARKLWGSKVVKPADSPRATSASTAEIAREIDAVLDQEKRTSDREP
ncbi:MAG: AtpZ/AtpI family protein [Planctomycetia bacterium]|nr:AtpZ/AtpI family protein [Planctomycetia bacterium]